MVEVCPEGVVEGLALGRHGDLFAVGAAHERAERSDFSGAREVLGQFVAVLEREAVLSTGVGSGVAIPHGKTPVVDQLVMAAGVVRTPLEFDALDGEPVELFFMLVGPESASSAHVKALSRISRLLRREQLRSGLRASHTSHDFLDIVRASEAI